MNRHQKINEGSILMAPPPATYFGTIWPWALTVIAARRGSDFVGSTTVYKAFPPPPATYFGTIWPWALTVIAARRGSDFVGSTTVYKAFPPLSWLMAPFSFS